MKLTPIVYKTIVVYEGYCHLSNVVFKVVVYKRCCHFYELLRLFDVIVFRITCRF